MPKLPITRFHSGLCYSDKYGLICVGGKTTVSKGYWECFKYHYNVDQLKFDNADCKKMEWTPLANLSEKRIQTCCLILDDEDKMIVCGGKREYLSPSELYMRDWREFDDTHLKVCELYDFVESKWIKLDGMDGGICTEGSLIQCKEFEW